jgi:hypothetical protein
MATSANAEWKITFTRHDGSTSFSTRQLSAIGNAHLIQMLEISSKVVGRWVAVLGSGSF